MTGRDDGQDLAVSGAPTGSWDLGGGGPDDGPADGTAVARSDTDGLLAAADRRQHLRNGVPDAQTAAARAECARAVQEQLGDRLRAVTSGVLGTAWTEVLDAHLAQPLPPSVPAGLGWLPLDRLRPAAPRRAGAEAPVWGVVVGGRLVGAVRLHPPGAAPDPVTAVLTRCRARGEVRLCEVLELRELRRQGAGFPVHSPVLRVAAEVESGLGGRVLAPWASGSTAVAPAPLPRARPRPRLVVAISGVDGSGKSTLREGIAGALERCGVPTSTVWVRPGMGLGPLAALAHRAKRLLRQDVAPGIRAVAAGDGAGLRSRTGAVGGIWVLLVTASFLVGVGRQHRAAGGVVLYDRHLVDALATLDFAYAGVDLRLPARAVRALLPRAGVSVYLDLPAELSVARKPDDLIGADAVRLQLEAYGRRLAEVPGLVPLDAARPASELLLTALQLVTGADRTDGAPARQG